VCKTSNGTALIDERFGSPPKQGCVKRRLSILPQLRGFGSPPKQGCVKRRLSILPQLRGFGSPPETGVCKTHVRPSP
jgi:hypothetical protein